MNIGRLALRVSVGAFFVGHGTQKLFGWFGGHGLEATAAGFEKLGLRPGKTNAVVAGVAEAAGGALLVAGLATPVAVTALTATMLTAIERVHLKNGPWLSKSGYEYNVVLIGALLTLAEVGPGGFSLDALFGRAEPRRCRGLEVLAVGALGSLAAHVLAERIPVPVEPPPAEQQSAADDGDEAPAA